MRKEICGQLPFVGKYLSAQLAYQHLYPELIELLDDEEREVVIMAIQAFSEMVELFLNSDNADNNITDKEAKKLWDYSIKAVEDGPPNTAHPVVQPTAAQVAPE